MTAREFASDCLVLARRQVEHVRQIPEKLLDVTLQPLMFVVLFSYVFGGVIAIPGGDYRDYLIGGVMVQSLAFGIMGPATSIATDLREGVVDRLRTLPIARASYLVGHVLSELAATLVGVTVLSVTGAIIGWGIHGGVAHAVAGYALIAAYALAMVWTGTLLGLVVRSPDAVQGLAFVVMFPMTFLASTFVPLAGLSPTLRTIAAWNPISTVAAAVRELFGNPTAALADPPWPLRHAVAAAALGCAAVLVVVVPLAVRAFRHRTSD
jgi:ABC transporter DrrB family efflux protein